MSSPRKHLNPAVEAAPGLHPTRRQGGARRELSERVVFRGEGREVDGWALNASRSGLRAIVEEVLPLGAQFEVEVGGAAARPGRVVWLQEEKDGAIVGVSYLDEAARSSSIPDIQVAPPGGAGVADPAGGGGAVPGGTGTDAGSPPDEGGDEGGGSGAGP